MIKKELQKNWRSLATQILKAELARKGFSYQDLVDALKKIGIDKTVNNVTVTINRGSFPFIFFLQCAEALGLEKINLV